MTTPVRLFMAMLAVLLYALPVYVDAFGDEAQRRVFRPRFRRSAAAASSGSGCNGSCVLDQTYDYAEASIIKSGGGACAGFSGTADTITSNAVTTHENAADDGDCTAITSHANYSGGAGGRGIHYPRKTGSNSGSGALKTRFTSVGPQVWMSYVVRYSSGMEFSGGSPTYTKDWYIQSPHLIMGFQGGGYGFNTLGSQNYPGSLDWSDIYPGGTSDGTWFCADYYFDFNASRAVVHVQGANVSLTKVLDSSSIDYGGRTAVDEFFNNNQSNVTVAGHTDFDDVRIDNDLSGPTDRIGCPGF